MDSKNKSIAIGLGALALGGIVYYLSKMRGGGGEPPVTGTCLNPNQHWNGTACVDKPVDPVEPLVCEPGWHPNATNTACVPDTQNGEQTPESIWAKANLVAFPLTSDQILRGITGDGVEPVGVPSLEIIDFHLTKVYPQAKIAIFPVDEWIAKLEAEDDNITVEIAGDPCHMEDGQGHILPCVVGTRVGQLRGHTWGAALVVYEWDGEVWNQVWTGMLGPNQGWQTPLQYEIAEGLLTIKSSIDWTIPSNMVTYNIEVLPVGNWKYYCFAQSQYITEHFPANQPVSIPIVLRAYGSRFSSYSPGTPMQLLSYVVRLNMGTAGCVMSFNSDWYEPPTTLQNYLTKEEQGIITNSAGQVLEIDTSIAHTILSYSISMQELLSECLKVWRIRQGWFGTWLPVPTLEYPMYNAFYPGVKHLDSADFIINVTKYGDQ